MLVGHHVESRECLFKLFGWLGLNRWSWLHSGLATDSQNTVAKWPDSVGETSVSQVHPYFEEDFLKLTRNKP